MRTLLVSALFVSVSAIAISAEAAPPSLEVKVQDIDNNEMIPVDYAYCKPTKGGKSDKGVNRRPSITWSKGPEGTKSYAIIMVDPDVPADLTNAGKEGKIIPEKAKRQSFFHWAQIDLPATAEGFPSGSGNEYPQEQLDLGKPGQNTYAEFYKDKPKGEYIGYDGPCPPWNDERIHHYHFQVYALDVPTLGLKKFYAAKDASDALQPHVLEKGEVVGTYTLNAKLTK